MAEQLDFLIIWVPDHRKIFGNEKADDLEKLERALCAFCTKSSEQMGINNKANMAQI